MNALFLTTVEPESHSALNSLTKTQLELLSLKRKWNGVMSITFCISATRGVFLLDHYALYQRKQVVGGKRKDKQKHKQENHCPRTPMGLKETLWDTDQQKLPSSFLPDCQDSISLNQDPACLKNSNLQKKRSWENSNILQLPPSCNRKHGRENCFMTDTAIRKINHVEVHFNVSVPILFLTANWFFRNVILKVFDT